ncbi:MAG: C1 family peptidase [Kiritimatiellae bacterium]|nr:C1 family peptidase [Kiritimatiellia bacterium]
MTNAQTSIGVAVAMVSLVPLATHGKQEQPAHPRSTEENNIQFTALWNGETLGTGARRPNATQWKWGENNLIKTKGVRWNALGLQRANSKRKANGLKMLTKDNVIGKTFERDSVGAKGGKAKPPEDPVTVIPATVDNSTLKYFPPIRSQGGLNSCAQFAAVYYTLTHMTAMANEWDAKTGGDAFRLSPKWTYNMVNGGQNAGSWHYDAYSIAKKHGIALWTDFPYDSDYREWCMNPDAWRAAVCLRAKEAGKIRNMDSDAGLDLVKEMLVNGYILNFATYINSWQWTPIKDDPETEADDAYIGKNCVYGVAGTSGGHTMTIVGYSDDVWIDLNSNDRIDNGEKGALRIANSWGTGWNEGGFCWIAYSALSKPNSDYSDEGIFWYNEATWVTARTNYEPQLVAEFTLNHAKRCQINMSLGYSDPTSTTPSTQWIPERILYYSGGNYAFDGTTTSCDATFCLDLTDLVPASSGTHRYYIKLADSLTGDTATMRAFSLVDATTGTIKSSSTVPVYADGSQTLVYADVDSSVPEPSVVLTAPEQLTATTVRGSVMLSWNDTSTNESGFYIERSQRTGKSYSAFTRIATTSEDATSHTDLVSSGSYRYRLQAFDSSTQDTSPYSTAVTVRVK